MDLADVITSQIVDVLKAIERRSEDMRKKVISITCFQWKLLTDGNQEFQFFEKLLSEKEKTNSERLKVDLSV